jgi:flagellum-specific peptidoglycan hydrolase FlgJ
VNPASKPRWQQAAALVSLGAGGAVTGFSFVPGAVADPAAPPITQIRLLALKQAAQARPGDSQNGMLRSAIVNVARYYLRLAAARSPAEMEALIWQRDSANGADHGQTCAAFASLTLELGAQVVGQQSWVTGGSTYPWPLQDWADVRVDPNPDSPQITSVLQDARAQDRWHPVGDGYQPQAGDWVLFDGHVEVVTSYANGVLDTIGGDSLPDFTVNAHQFSGPLPAQGVMGFVDNGDLVPAAASSGGTAAQPAPASTDSADGVVADAAVPGVGQPTPATPAGSAAPRVAPSASPAIPGLAAAADSAAARPGTTTRPAAAAARRPVARTAAAAAGAAALSAIPGVPVLAARPAAAARSNPASPAAGASSYGRHQPAAAAAVPESPAQQEFIAAVADGAIAAQRRYGVPAAVTIAQAIDESAWGQSSLASRDHNLFGIKGIGPAGSDRMPTQEYVNGEPVTVTSSFRVYRNVAESIDDHGRLLATSGYYQRAMSYRENPNAFAAALTGVYATDPQYGTKIISLMAEYDLYQFDATPAGSAASAASPHPAAPSGSVIPGVPAAAPSASPSASASASPSASASAPPSASPPTTSTSPAATPSPGSPAPSSAPASPSAPTAASSPAAPSAAPSPSASPSPAAPSAPDGSSRPTGTSSAAANAASGAATRSRPAAPTHDPAPSRRAAAGRAAAASATAAVPGVPATAAGNAGIPGTGATSTPATAGDPSARRRAGRRRPRLPRREPTPPRPSRPGRPPRRRPGPACCPIRCAGSRARPRRVPPRPTARGGRPPCQLVPGGPPPHRRPPWSRAHRGQPDGQPRRSGSVPGRLPRDGWPRCARPPAGQPGRRPRQRQARCPVPERRRCRRGLRARRGPPLPPAARAGGRPRRADPRG